MTPALFQRFQSLVAVRTGLHIRPREQEAFQATLAARAQARCVHSNAVHMGRLARRPGAAHYGRTWSSLVAVVPFVPMLQVGHVVLVGSE